MILPCPCGQTLRTSDAMAGKRVRCPACQAMLVVPELSSAVVAADRVGTVPSFQPPQPGANAAAVPNPLAARPGKTARKEPSGLAQLALAGGVGLLVMVAVTGGIILTRNGQAGTVAAANAGTFKEFVSAEGKFRVMLPGTPTQKRQQVGPITLMMYTLENRDGAYVAGFCDVPIPANEPEWQTQKRLDGAREGAVRNVNGALLKESRVRLHGRDPGREIEANVPGKGIIRARFFVVGRKMYQVMVVGNPSFAHSADATRFLDSLSRTN